MKKREVDALQFIRPQHLPNLRPVREDQFGDYTIAATYHLLRKYNSLSELPFAPPVAAFSRLQPKHVTQAKDYDPVLERKFDQTLQQSRE